MPSKLPAPTDARLSRRVGQFSGLATRSDQSRAEVEELLLDEVKGSHAVFRASEDECAFGRGEEHPCEVGRLRRVNAGAFEPSVRSAIQTSKTFLAAALTVSDSPLTVTPAHEDRLSDRPTVSGSTWRPLTLEIATTAMRSR
jgi:hypothetical protein